MKRFTGRPAIVTAAASGIGRAIALRLHEEGAHVLAVDIHAEGLAALPKSDTLRTLQMDVTGPEAPQAIVDRFIAAVPPGSFVVISHLASDVEQDTMAEMGRRLNSSMTQQFTMRTRAQVTSFFDGLTLVEPGVVRTHEWRPDSDADGKIPGVLWAGVARKD